MRVNPAGHTKTLSLFIVAVSLALAGCDAPNLDDPETFRNALTDALGSDEIEIRHEGGEELAYRKGTQDTHTGWYAQRWKAEQLMEHDEPLDWDASQPEPLRQLALFKDGSKDGPCIEYFKNSNTRLQGQYKDGKKDGIWREWDEKGNESRVTYVDGKRVNP